MKKKIILEELRKKYHEEDFWNHCSLVTIISKDYQELPVHFRRKEKIKTKEGSRTIVSLWHTMHSHCEMLL